MCLSCDYLVIECHSVFFLNMVHELVTLPFCMVFMLRKPDDICKVKIGTFFSVNFFPLLSCISPIYIYIYMYTGKADVQSKYFCYGYSHLFILLLLFLLIKKGENSAPPPPCNHSYVKVSPLVHTSQFQYDL